MGTQSSQQQVRTSQLKSIQDDRYGGQIYLSLSTGTVYQQLFSQQKNLPALLSLISRRKTLIHPNLLTVRSHFVKNQGNELTFHACGNEKKSQVYLQFPYLTRTLQDVIQEYSIKGITFPQRQLKRIFMAVVEGLSFLARSGCCHGDVKSSTILFDHLNTPKLIDSYFLSGGKTSYQIVLQNPSSMSLLAPQQLRRIKHHQGEDLSTIHMSQVFAFGMTMLEAMTYETSMEAYDLDKLEIVEGWRERKSRQIEEIRYSKEIREVVMRCVQEEAVKRPTFGELLQRLRSIKG